MFNNYFTSVFSEVDLPADATRSNPATATLYNITVSVAEVESVLANLDTTKATGPDEISARLQLLLRLYVHYTRNHLIRVFSHKNGKLRT